MRDRSAPLSPADLESLAWEKMDGLLPVVVQDSATLQLLMLGYMNREALDATIASGRVTFWSRSRRALWTKGETSGNGLRLSAIHADCDSDALLVLADPEGPTCHLGTASCFAGAETPGPGWLSDLSRIVAERARARAGGEASYTRRLLDEGPARIAQKVGEEGVEVALAGVASPSAKVAEEIADLLYHVAVLMEARGLGWEEIVSILQARHRPDATS